MPASAGEAEDEDDCDEQQKSACHAGSLEVCALLTKPERRRVDLPIKYTGFEIPNRFAIGYGLDFGERYRNLPYVAALKDEHVERMTDGTAAPGSRRGL